MFTNRFKCLVGGLVVLFLFGLLAVAQYNTEQQVNQLQRIVGFQVVVSPMPSVAVTVVPTVATPSAVPTLKPVKIIAKPMVSPIATVK
jgi:ABC-type transport system involved in cytochrome c biogenesis permease subunit